MAKFIERKRPNYKYKEDQFLAELSTYIDSTYKGHYVQDDEEKLQVLDMWDAAGISEEVCKGTALKYIMRYGKKEGKNFKDLLKAAHYIILLAHFSDKHRMDFLKDKNSQGTIATEEDQNYDTFGK